MWFTSLFQFRSLTLNSGVATGVARGVECHPWQRKNCQKSWKKGEKSGKNREKRGKIGKNRKNLEISFTLPLLTDRAGYATDFEGRWGDEPGWGEAAVKIVSKVFLSLGRWLRWQTLLPCRFLLCWIKGILDNFSLIPHFFSKSWDFHKCILM